MKLKEFLSLCTDEEAMIELEIEFYYEEEYIYESFWLSDYRTNNNTAKYYNDYIVTGISFLTEFSESDIQIQISEKDK